MFVGFIIRVSPGDYLQNVVKFNYQIFFNVLLPPIILNSGYELHQVGPRYFLFAKFRGAKQISSRQTSSEI